MEEDLRSEDWLEGEATGDADAMLHRMSFESQGLKRSGRRIPFKHCPETIPSLLIFPYRLTRRLGRRRGNNTGVATLHSAEESRTQALRCCPSTHVLDHTSQVKRNSYTAVSKPMWLLKLTIGHLQCSVLALRRTCFGPALAWQYPSYL